MVAFKRDFKHQVQLSVDHFEKPYQTQAEGVNHDEELYDHGKPGQK
jgi:hypothetical protein